MKRPPASPVGRRTAGGVRFLAGAAAPSYRGGPTARNTHRGAPVALTTAMIADALRQVKAALAHVGPVHKGRARVSMVFLRLILSSHRGFLRSVAAAPRINAEEACQVCSIAAALKRRGGAA